MKKRPYKIALRLKHSHAQKLSWEETYKQMAKSDEDWSDWEAMPNAMKRRQNYSKAK